MLKNNLDFKHIDKIIKKGLTNPDYYRVLGIIGQSEESLDNTQIIANFEKIYGPWNKYKYEILKELSPINGNVTDELLFIWEDLKILELAQLEEKCSKILEKINQSFYIKIDNHLKENYIFLRDGDSLEESNKWIKIQSNEKNAESFNPYFDEGILIIIFSKSQVWIFPTLTIKKKGKLHVYSKSQISIEKRQFLNTTIKKQISFLYTPGHKSETNEKNNWPRTHQLLNEICEMRESYPIDIDKYLREWLLNQIADSKKENLQETIQDYLKYIHEKTDELNKITEDREYFSYSLNLKGLFLFLILYGSIKKTKGDEIVFNNVLFNPYIIKIAPFLKYLNEFEKFGFKGKKLVVIIAEELRNQLHLDIKNGIILLERAIERYYKDVEEYFKEYEKYFKNLELVKHSVISEDVEHYNILQNKIYDYRKDMITILRDFIKYKEEFYSFMLSKPITY